MRLVKRVAQLGVASRRKSEQLIAAGQIAVNGAVVTDPAKDVTEDDQIAHNGDPVTAAQTKTFMLNKPRGVLSTASDPHGRRKVTDFVKGEGRLYPIGRLDTDTTGLILISNDGELANRLTHPRYEVTKTYRAEVTGVLSDQTAAKLAGGVMLDDGVTLPAKLSVTTRGDNSSVVELTIREGRNRQVRRMLDAVGHSVRSLERIAFGPLKLGTLKNGQSRELTAGEIATLSDASR
jgi:23S rRNA pseudouridine2605 synthase